MEKITTYIYRTEDGSKVIEREFDFFDDEPTTIVEDKVTYHKAMNQATAGWSYFTYYNPDNPKQELSEYWKHGTAPESYTRDGIFYKMKFGVPSIGDGARHGSGLMSKTSKSFQDLMKNIHKRNPGSKLNENM